MSTIDPREILWNLASDLEDLQTTGHLRLDERESLPPLPEVTQSANAGLNFGDSLAAIEAEVAECIACGLHSGRTRTVPGVGAENPVRLMIIGEAPGADEDRLGEPFVGAAGQYLDKWLGAVHLQRGQGVFITNILKCRPPSNRDPMEAESNACMPYLLRQIDILKPEMILCLGRISASILTGRSFRISRERGQWFRFRNIPCIATFHPSAVLRSPDLRRPVWEDIKAVKAALDGQTPG